MTFTVEINDSLLPALRKWISTQKTAQLIDGEPVVVQHYADEEDALVAVLESFLAGVAIEHSDLVPAVAARMEDERQAKAALRAAVRPRKLPTKD